MTIQQAFELALQHHQGGHLMEAEALYQQILAEEPHHADALHYLGVLAHQQGRNEVAVDLMRRAITLTPGVAGYYSNYGAALRALGQLDEAIAAYRQTIALKPDFAEAHGNLGNALRDQGKLEDAIAAYRKAITFKPAYPEGLSNLGATLAKQGKLDEAISACRQAIALKPTYPDAHGNLGTALASQGKLDEAIASYRRAISLKAVFPEAHCNLGIALASQGKLVDAIAAFQEAIALKPAYAEAHCNLGSALANLGRLDEAITACRQAIVLRPDDPDAHVNLGNALKDQGRLEESVAEFRRAMALAPDDAEAHGNLLLALNYQPGLDAPAIAGEQRRWNDQHAEPLRSLIKPHGNDHDAYRRLRIGYVSGDFREHVVGYNVLPLLARHDPRNFEIFCYAQVARGDALTERFRTISQHWCDTVPLTNEQLAARIREDKIDILVDLALHTAHNRLLVFARKPAPVQVTWAGYPGSTGLSVMDYRLSDPHLDPPGIDESVYSEKTVRLPHSFWCYEPNESRDIPVNGLPALNNGFVTFGCFNTFCKINDAVLDLWARLLLSVPGSHLLLLAPEGSVRQNVIKRLGRHGINAACIGFVSRQPRSAYLELYQRIDVSLDTLPYNGHTTSLDSFWMGVPVVTQIGETIAGRAGLSQLRNLQLTELIAATSDDYVAIAVALAKDLPHLSNLRSTLRQRLESSPIMDISGFTRNIETAYREMWRGWCRQFREGNPAGIGHSEYT